MMMSLPTLLLARRRDPAGRSGAGKPRDIPCLASLLPDSAGLTLFLVRHTEARYLLPAVPFILYFALRSVEAALQWHAALARLERPASAGRAIALAIGAALLAAALRVGLHQALLEEDPVYRADLERRAAELLLAARRGDGRLLWHGRWHTLHTRWAGLVPHDEFFGIFHFPDFAHSVLPGSQARPEPAAAGRPIPTSWLWS